MLDLAGGLGRGVRLGNVGARQRREKRLKQEDSSRGVRCEWAES